MLQNPRRYRGADWRAAMAWLRGVLAALAPAADSMTVRLVDEQAMAKLNRAYRGRPGSTDVLSFPGSRSVEGWHLGDVVVAVPVMRRQAASAGHPAAAELRLLLLHGALHCLGHDHERDHGRMERLERRLRRRFIVRSAA